MTDDLTRLSSGEFESLLLSTRQEARKLRARVGTCHRQGASTRAAERALSDLEPRVGAVESEWWRRYTGGREGGV